MNLPNIQVAKSQKATPDQNQADSWVYIISLRLLSLGCKDIVWNTLWHHISNLKTINGNMNLPNILVARIQNQP